MKLKFNIAKAAALMVIVASAAVAQVKTDYDRSANFHDYKTYSWANVSTRNPLMVNRIKSAVNAALAAKGWTEVPSNGAASVVAIETTRNQQTLDTFYNSFGGGRRWGGGFGDATTTTNTYKVGTLVVDIFDASNKNLIWHGSANGTLSNNSDKNIKQLSKNVDKMFKHFPPDSAKA